MQDIVQKVKFPNIALHCNLPTSSTVTLQTLALICLLIYVKPLKYFLSLKTHFEKLTILEVIGKVLTVELKNILAPESSTV